MNNSTHVLELRLPLPTHNTDGGLLPDNIRRRLPTGTVRVETFYPVYYAYNANEKKLRLPESDDVNYIPTFDNVWPTHDFDGTPLSNEVRSRLPFGAYNIYVYDERNFERIRPFVSFTDIDGNSNYLDL
jgi:hypothetical protein